MEILPSLLTSVLEHASPRGKFAVLPPVSANLLVLGAGKAAALMAAEFEQAYGSSVHGTVVVPLGYTCATQSIEVITASHPVPDANSEAAALRLLELAHAARDHVVFLGSGGASSLLVAPAPGITLADKIAIGRQLLAKGAQITQFNKVRRCLSAIKGGRLAAACKPASVTTYLISDVPEDDPAVIGSGPTIAQDCDVDAALEILASYQVAVPDHVVAAMRANTVPEVVTGDVHMLVTPAMVLQAAEQQAAELGLSVTNLGLIDGEAKEVAEQIASQVVADPSPRVLLSGGELTVNVTGSGKGGANLEFLLALALALDGQENVSALAVDTDGCDGNSGVAGAQIYPDTLFRAQKLGLDPAAMLAANDAYTFFADLGDLVDTGPTFTNVNDFRAVVIN